MLKNRLINDTIAPMVALLLPWPEAAHGLTGGEPHASAGRWLDEAAL